MNGGYDQKILKQKVVELTEDEIQEFQSITLKRYGRKLTELEAEDQLSRMVLAFELIQKNVNVAIEITKKEDQNG